LKIPVVRGRAFTGADGPAGAPVIIVNQAFVARESRQQEPLGRQLVVGGVARTIVGIVGDIPQKGSFGNLGPVAAAPASYVPVAQTSDAFLKTVHAWFSPSWFVRMRGPVSGVAAEMQRAVEAVDPLLPFAKFRTIDEVRGEAVATQRAQAVLLTTLAGLAVLLAAVGLYGLVANGVAERTRELGIRLALGATSRQAMIAAAVPGLVLASVGVAVGAIAARAGASLLRSLVWGVSTADPLTFAAAVATVLAVAVVAVLLPALRIVRLNPIRALRQT
jgi:ABC-type antimicrobial peptide transport system permease subunit